MRWFQQIMRSVIETYFNFISNPSNNFYQLPFLIYYSQKMSLSSLKNLQQCLISFPIAQSVLSPSYTLTLSCGSYKTQISIDDDLNMRFQDLNSSLFYKFTPDSMIFPLFNNKKVYSVQMHHPITTTVINLSSSSVSTDNQRAIEIIYSKLVRIFTHKGFNEFYKPIRRLGRGSFATVYLVEHKYTSVRRAAKVFSKQGQKIEFKGKEALQNEIETLRTIDHPNLIKYDGLYQTDSLVYLVTQYLSGGTLEDTLKTKTIHTGELIQRIIKDILSGLAYLDEKQIMHRDIKPDNIIFREEDQHWVIGDFGLAAKSNQDYLYDKCGTMGYIAPEIMDLEENQRYGQACDTYSLGVIAYQLIVGELPFKVEAENFFDRKIIWVLFDRPECQEVHPAILEFLKRLLEKDPKSRIKPKQALNCPFFKDEKVVGELLSFHQKRRAKRYERILQMANCN